MGDKDATYELLREAVARLVRSPNHDDRRLIWATDRRSVALARDPDGRVEMFIPGEVLAPSITAVDEVLEHRWWTDADGNDLPANRLVLPAGEHFDHFAALLCVELIEHGIELDSHAAFAAVEPLIALALTREAITDLTLMGLIGELAFLEALLVAAPSRTEALLGSWAGSAPSSRDFQLGGVGIEVKTTQGAASVHQVEGVHQVEIGHPHGGGIETGLYLLSLGVRWLFDPAHGRTLPDLVDSLLTLAGDPVGRAELLGRIKQYGGDAGLGYDHERDRHKARYSTRFYFRFERLYDMTDDRLRLLTSADLVDLKNVDASSVTFRVTLEDRVRGVHNPTVGLQPAAREVLRAAQGGDDLA